MDLENFKYPIGKFSIPEKFGKPEYQLAVENIQKFPDRLIKEVRTLNDKQLQTPYRPEGWTLKQLVHHCADSHINCFIRYKLALTEDSPTIKPYGEADWAELADAKNIDIEPSLAILQGVHIRWVILLKSLSEEQLNRTFNHPEHNQKITLRHATAMYAWHCNHHLSHVLNLKEREAW